MVTALYILAGLVLLYFGAEWLVKGAAALAFRLGVSSLVVGLTVVAFGTSAPEMTVSVQAAFGGLGDIAVTNVIGSNSFNIALILGVASLIYPIRVTKQLIRWDVPVMIVVSVLCVLFLWDHHLSRLEGVIFFTGIVFYTVWTFYQAKRQPNQDLPVEDVLHTEQQKLGLFKVWGLILAGLVFLVLGSKFLIAGSLRLARGYGISEAVIGLTIVSAGTSLPELATSVVAAIRKQPDIAIGNVVGSNIFNILGILGLSSLLMPYSSPGLTGVDLAMMLGMAMISFPFMWTGFVLNRIEGGIYLLCYGFYLYYLWPK
jgi:cation:H+ antiporter